VGDKREADDEGGDQNEVFDNEDKKDDDLHIGVLVVYCAALRPECAAVPPLPDDFRLLDDDKEAAAWNTFFGHGPVLPSKVPLLGGATSRKEAPFRFAGLWKLRRPLGPAEKKASTSPAKQKAEIPSRAVGGRWAA
jgi:hypothetical protein